MPDDAPVPGLQSPDPLELSEQIDALGKLAAAPAFLDLLQEIGDTPADERSGAAARLATVDELKRRGLPVTEANRLTLRYFEERPDQSLRAVVTDAPRVEAADEPELPPGIILADEALSSGWTACATTGYTQGGVLVCSSIGKVLAMDEEMLPE